MSFVSLEMRAKELIERIMSASGRIDLQRLRRARLSSGEAERLSSAVRETAMHDLAIDDKAFDSPPDIDEILSRAAKLHSESPLDMMVIDYLQLATAGAGDAGMKRNEALTFISRRLKMFAIQCGIPVIALSQLNREMERRVNRRPHALGPQRLGSPRARPRTM